MKNKIYPYYEVHKYSTLKELLNYTGKKYKDKIAFKYVSKKKDIEKTFKEFNEEVNSLGKYINSLKLNSKNVGVIGENSYEWILTYMSVTTFGNVIVPIDKELEFDEMSDIIREANINLLFCSNTYSDYIEKFESLFPDLKIINLKDMVNCLIEGKKLKSINEKVTSDMLAAIIFTSGTTGKPKGVMLTHENLCEDVRVASMQLLITGDSVLVLPLHHTFSFTANVLCMFNIGHTICIPNSLKRIDETLKKYKPKTMFLVPLLVEAFYNKVWKTIKDTKKYYLVKFLIFISNILCTIGIDLRRVFFKQIIEAFGGELNLIISGGAALDKKYVKAFRDFGIDVLNGYGITECSPIISVNRNNYYRDGSVGTPLKDVDVKIVEGEILVKSKIVMKGYYNSRELTDDVMDNGYFKTGDIGYLDKNGFIFITGRKKNVIILENGKNVYPEELEEKLVLKDEIKEVVIYEKEGKITAEIFPDFDVVPKNVKVDLYMQKIIDEFNKKLPYYKKIQSIVIRDKEFEKTTTKKIKRSLVNVR